MQLVMIGEKRFKTLESCTLQYSPVVTEVLFPVSLVQLRLLSSRKATVPRAIVRNVLAGRKS